MSDKVTSFIPSPIKPFTTNYNCPISEDINVRKYNVTIDGDTENDRVYMNLGYDGKRQYDCSFFLESKDAFELGQKLIHYSQKATITHKDYIRSKDWINKLTELIQNKIVTDIGIKCISVFSDDPEDSLFGTIVLQVYYITKMNNSDEAIILSDGLTDKDYTYFDELIEKFKTEYEIENVFIDTDGYKKLKSRINDKLNKWLQKTQSKTTPRHDIQTMLPNNLKDGVKDIADRVIDKLKENQNN